MITVVQQKTSLTDKRRIKTIFNKILKDDVQSQMLQNMQKKPRKSDKSPEEQTPTFYSPPSMQPDAPEHAKDEQRK